MDSINTTRVNIQGGNMQCPRCFGFQIGGSDYCSCGGKYSYFGKCEICGWDINCNPDHDPCGCKILGLDKKPTKIECMDYFMIICAIILLLLSAIAVIK